jgi:hypothetical protein
LAHRPGEGEPKEGLFAFGKQIDGAGGDASLSGDIGDLGEPKALAAEGGKGGVGDFFQATGVFGSRHGFIILNDSFIYKVTLLFWAFCLLR